MKQLKKLTRVQRNILSRKGYDDLESTRYLKEDGNCVIFVDKNGSQILIDKAEYYKQK